MLAKKFLINWLAELNSESVKFGLKRVTSLGTSLFNDLGNLAGVSFTSHKATDRCSGHAELHLVVSHHRLNLILLTTQSKVRD
jgi:hypothetical protein